MEQLLLSKTQILETVLLLLLLRELLHRSAVALPGECPPPILFRTCKFVYEFLCICNTYINSMSLRNFREGNLIIKLVYFYCYSLLLSFLAMDVVAHAFFKYYHKVKNVNHKAIVMKPVLVCYESPALFHF